MSVDVWSGIVDALTFRRYLLSAKRVGSELVDGTRLCGLTGSGSARRVGTVSDYSSPQGGTCPTIPIISPRQCWRRPILHGSSTELKPSPPCMLLRN
jgi:hypothetical protein